jgi:GT2 family glycosyltransferase
VQAERADVAVAVILVHYRFPELTLDCLASLAGGNLAECTVFLVDNSPGDGSRETLLHGLAATGAEHHYIAAPSNLGFGGGMNLGIREARRRGFSHVALMNNDVVAKPAFGTRLLAEIRKTPGTPLAGLVVDADTGRPSYNIGRISPWVCLINHVFTLDPDVAFDFVSGCLAVFPLSVLDRTGIFREDYFMYDEDTELCMRIRAAGIPLRFCPSVVVAHRHGSSADRLRLPKLYYLIRNHTHLMLLHGNPTQKSVYMLFLAAILLRQTLSPRRFRRTWAAVTDALYGRMGMRPEDTRGAVP